MNDIVAEIRQHLTRAPKAYLAMRFTIALMGLSLVYGCFFDMRSFLPLLIGILFLIPFSLGVFSVFYWIRLGLFCYFAFLGVFELWAYSALTAYAGIKTLKEHAALGGYIPYYWHILVIICLRFFPPLTLVWSRRLAKLGR